MMEASAATKVLNIPPSSSPPPPSSSPPPPSSSPPPPSSSPPAPPPSSSPPAPSSSPPAPAPPSSPPPPSCSSSSPPPPSCSSSSIEDLDSVEEFSRQLEEIIRVHGTASTLLETGSVMEDETENVPKMDTDKDVSEVLQSLSSFSSPEDKLEQLLQRHVDAISSKRQQLQTLKLLQEERLSSVAARSKLETLCRKLQAHYRKLREEMVQRCREEEEKRSEITSHFQISLQEIQSHIEQQSGRNDALRRENASLSDKLESLMSQCELREQSLEKIERHRELQHKLSEAKVQQANAVLSEAQDKHKREKEYLLREAIDKTKKCYAMKEQELSMKKKLSLYAQKFDEFQATLAKSNEIYAHFKKEMENMSEKMKNLEKESDQWKTRFENCNKTLADMMVERTEKGHEYDLFVLKIQKLERLCRALQEERIGLYEKIKEVRLSNADDSSKPLPTLGHEDLQQVEKMEEQDPVLTEDMSRLRAEQAKLQEFAASLLTTSFNEKNQEGPNLSKDALSATLFPVPTKEKILEDPEFVSEVASPSAEEGRSEESHEEQKNPEVQHEGEATSDKLHKEENPGEQQNSEDGEKMKVLTEAMEVRQENTEIKQENAEVLQENTEVFQENTEVLQKNTEVLQEVQTVEKEEKQEVETRRTISTPPLSQENVRSDEKPAAKKKKNRKKNGKNVS